MIIFLMRKTKKSGARKTFVDGPQRAQAQKNHSIKLIRSDMIKLDGSHKGMKQLNVAKGNFFRPEIQELFINGSKSGYVKMIDLKAKKLVDWVISIVQYGMILVDPITVSIFIKKFNFDSYLVRD